MSFLKRLSRSRGSSNSYVDDDGYEREQLHHQPVISSPTGAVGSHPSLAHDSSTTPLSNNVPAGPGGRPPSSYRSPVNNPQLADAQPDGKMYTASGRSSTDHGNSGSYASSGQQRPMNAGIPRGSSGMTRDSGYVDDSPGTPLKASAGGMDGGASYHHQAPDPLTRAFNEAIRPYHEKIENLEAQLANMQAFVDQMEQQRMDIYAWIDKRGLRPDVPPAIAKQMDSHPESASALNAQLDRKITIVNFDLHRLQDDLNDSISSAHFASAMAKFLPDVQRLADIRGGSRYAYELVIKLVGNLNSHGGLEAGAGGTDAEIEEDRRARAAFYARMDEELLDIIQRRSGEGEEWAVAREVKRLEKNGAYLKNLGIDSYFPRSLDAMRSEAQYRGGQSTPPRYQ